MILSPYENVRRMFHKRGRFNNRKEDGKQKMNEEEMIWTLAILQEAGPPHCRFPENEEQGIYIKEALQEGRIEGNLVFRM